MTGHRCDTGYFDRTVCPEPCDTMHSYCTRCGKRQDRCAWADTPSVPPSSAVQGSVRTEGPDEGSGPQNGTESFRVDGNVTAWYCREHITEEEA